jgi:hypothetical protein
MSFRKKIFKSIFGFKPITKDSFKISTLSGTIDGVNKIFKTNETDILFIFVHGQCLFETKDFKKYDDTIEFDFLIEFERERPIVVSLK